MGSTVEVDTASLMRAARDVDAARIPLDEARRTEAGHLGGDRDAGCWATIAAMRTGASATDRQLADLVAGLGAWAATVRAAAAGYDAADGRAGGRFGRAYAD